MAKINVTLVSKRGKFEHEGKTHRFGDVFPVLEKDKRIQMAIKCRVLKKTKVAPPKEKVVEPVAEKE